MKQAKDDQPNTEASISEITGAITLRVLWAAMKTVLGFSLFYLIFFGIVVSIQSYFGWDDTWQSNWPWALPVVTIFLSMLLYEATRHKSLHRKQWYFPKTNAFTSFLMSAYAVLSVWALISVDRSFLWLILYSALLGVPAFIYYILSCGYYLVMMQRYPNYVYEDFAIQMPSVLLELSLKEGGISGAQNGEEDGDDY